MKNNRQYGESPPKPHAKPVGPPGAKPSGGGGKGCCVGDTSLSGGMTHLKAHLTALHHMVKK